MMAKLDGAADDDTINDGPTRADANGPARIHADDAIAAENGADNANATHNAATAAS